MSHVVLCQSKVDKNVSDVEGCKVSSASRTSRRPPKEKPAKEGVATDPDSKVDQVRDALAWDPKMPLASFAPGYWPARQETNGKSNGTTFPTI